MCDDKKLKELCEKCYQICQKNNWDNTKIKARKNLTVKEIKSYARKYMIEYLNVSKEELNKLVLFFVEYSDRVLLTNHKSIIVQMINSNFISEDNLYDVDWVQKNLRSYASKFCYEICQNYNWQSIEIRSYCDKYSIDICRLNTLAKEYIINVLKWSEKQQEELYLNRMNKNIESRRKTLRQNPTSKYVKVLSFMLTTNDEYEIAKIIESSSLGFKGLRNYVSDYTVVYHDGIKTIKDELNNKFDEYIKKNAEQIKKQQEELREKVVKQNLKNAREKINEFIIGDYVSITELCTSELDEAKLKEYINLVKAHDNNLYNEYIRKLEILKKEKYSYSILENKEILDLMDKGILENGTRREFDILDYYLYTNLNLKQFLSALKGELSSKEYRILKTFVNKYGNDNVLSYNEIENIYKTNTVIGIKTDGEGNIIPESGRLVTKEEKQEIIMYLNSNNVPITRKTYNIAFRRWTSRILCVESKKEEKIKTK